MFLYYRKTTRQSSWPSLVISPATHPTCAATKFPAHHWHLVAGYLWHDSPVDFNPMWSSAGWSIYLARIHLVWGLWWASGVAFKTLRRTTLRAAPILWHLQGGISPGKPTNHSWGSKSCYHCWLRGILIQLIVNGLGPIWSTLYWSIKTKKPCSNSQTESRILKSEAADLFIVFWHLSFCCEYNETNVRWEGSNRVPFMQLIQD